MNQPPRKPYCLSRQHPELATRSQGPRSLAESRPASPQAPPPVNTSNPLENEPGKGL